MRMARVCLAVVSSLAALGGAAAAAEVPVVPRGELDCRVFLLETAPRAPNAAAPSVAPSPAPPPDKVEPGEARDLARCLCGMRQDVLWVRGQVATSKKAEDARQRLNKLLAEIGQLAQKAAQAKDGTERADLIGALRAQIARLEKDLGPSPPARSAASGTAAATLAALRREVERLRSTDEAERTAASLEIAGTVLGAVGGVAGSDPDASGAGLAEGAGWRVLLARSATQGETPAGERVLSPARFNHYLLDAHDAYDRLKKWERAASRSSLDSVSVDVSDACGSHETNLAAEVEERLQTLAGDLHSLLDDRGLRRPMTGVLVQALGFTRASADGQKAVDQAAQQAVVRFESRHQSLGPEWLDGSLLGHFGVHPAFNLVLPDPTARSANERTITTTVLTDGTTRETTVETGKSTRVCVTPPGGETQCDKAVQPAWTPQFEQALSWGLGARGGVHWTWAELSVFVRGGQVFTQPKVSTIEAQADTPAAASLLDATSRRRDYWEYGGRLTLFSERRGQRGHHDLGFLRPLLELEYGRREDYRFSGLFTEAADLERFGRHPERREFLRFALSGLPILGAGESFELSLAVEREWKRGGLGLPEGTKVFVQGRLDLFGLVTGKKSGS